ncbi:hypothetical protein AVEN_62385-1 [Araneus ventricosus]|uniref:Uncharacterized protein n=1 Tax=Araneus ventricosus TaxID=182803 RepID=A0A4Y2IVV4_ARAVE|nr:hypothetical protein AVEN_62385-1 [Araneus ventricosus]
MTSVWSIILRMYLKDSRCNSLSAEAGVLTAITVHGPIPPEGGTQYHPPGKQEPAYLFRLLIRVLAIPNGQLVVYNRVYMLG